MYLNTITNGGSMTNTLDVVATSIKLVRRVNGVDVLTERR